MRLIDADELEARVINFQGRGKKTFLEMIASQPTAYDPDKVVEQLEKQKANKFEWRENTKSDVMTYYYDGQIVAFIKAIEIVKGGAEWE